MADALKQLGDNLWIAEGPIVNFHSFPYPTRMVLARLANDAVWVWSPIPLTNSIRVELAGIGAPAHIVSPNKIHHLFISEWMAEFPEAKVWGLPSTIHRCRNLKFTETLTDDPPDHWRDDIDQAIFRGSPIMDEIVFFHRLSRTAIFADLIENFSMDFLQSTPGWHGWRSTMARLWGITEPVGRAPLEWRLSFISRAGAREALKRVLSWKPENVVMAHGSIVHGDGEEFVRESFAWL